MNARHKKSKMILEKLFLLSSGAAFLGKLRQYFTVNGMIGVRNL